jgi:hypothetical protein
MKNRQNKDTTTNKRVYITPKIEKITIDHEISMVMMSGNPPGEGMPFFVPNFSIKKLLNL